MPASNGRLKRVQHARNAADAAARYLTMRRRPAAEDRQRQRGNQQHFDQRFRSSIKDRSLNSRLNPSTGLIFSSRGTTVHGERNALQHHDRGEDDEHRPEHQQRQHRRIEPPAAPRRRPRAIRASEIARGDIAGRFQHGDRRCHDRAAAQHQEPIAPASEMPRSRSSAARDLAFSAGVAQLLAGCRKGLFLALIIRHGLRSGQQAQLVLQRLAAVPGRRAVGDEEDGIDRANPMTCTSPFSGIDRRTHSAAA